MFKTDYAEKGFYYYAIGNENLKLSPVYYFKIYKDLVNEKSPTSRLIRQKNQNNGRTFTLQPRGKSWFSSVASSIASFLQIKNPETFTFHGFRRTATTWLAAQGVSIISIKHFGRWRSSGVVEEYIADSSYTKINIAKQIQDVQQNQEGVKETKKENQEISINKKTMLPNFTFNN